eukprot:1157356-Pelagomonas_calceolata.AAC.5
MMWRATLLFLFEFLELRVAEFQFNKVDVLVLRRDLGRIQSILWILTEGGGGWYGVVKFLLSLVVVARGSGLRKCGSGACHHSMRERFSKRAKNNFGRGPWHLEVQCLWRLERAAVRAQASAPSLPIIPE